MTKIDIATGHAANAKVWKNIKIEWDALRAKLYKVVRTRETFKDFSAASKDDKSKIKDVGGYVGGYLRAGKRSPKNVVYRQLLTLDIDYGHPDFWTDFCLQFDNEAVLHGTHSHSEESPRFRLIMPLNREAAPDEYSAVGRKVAGMLGIENFDNTTFELNRLMFWPSVSSDVDYYVESQSGPWLDVDEILGLYADWKDVSLWPTNKQSGLKLLEDLKKQEDPLSKRGIIGAFCRAYTIEEAIDRYLSDVYVRGSEDRFTYLNGTTANGLVVYEEKFAYSHHGSDPAGGKLSNVYDLVRLHKFGHHDTAVNSTKSSKLMEDLLQKDKKVKKIIARDLLESSKKDFSGFTPEDLDEVEDDVLEWMAELETDSKGKYTSGAPNLNLIFQNDALLKGAFGFNEFENKRYTLKPVPWRRTNGTAPLSDVDYAGVRNYIETVYGISSTFKVDDCLALQIELNRFNPVREYLDGLKWDKEKRIDALLVDYFGAKDSIYTREAIRKTLVGAVARVYVPGIKFDTVLTIVGSQGEGKSTFIKKLAQSWFSDTFLTVHGKEALEQIQGAWIIEIAELSGLRKADIEAVKHFITKQEDTFRGAYKRTPETYKRQCVFIGTTNAKDFLRDPTGNRRFIPISTNWHKRTKDVFSDLQADEVNQIWAEAVHYWRRGEKLYMSEEAKEIAVEEQKKHSEQDDRRGLIEAYLNALLPENWAYMDLLDRRIFLADELAPKGTVEREFVCVAEIWAECLGKEKENMTRYNTRDVNDILRSLDDWEDVGSTKNFPIYGKQKYYARRLI